RRRPAQPARERPERAEQAQRRPEVAQRQQRAGDERRGDRPLERRDAQEHRARRQQDGGGFDEHPPHRLRNADRPGHSRSGCGHVNPHPWASSAACTRFSAPSLISSADTYFLTVASASPSRSPITAFESPAASPRNTCSSRGVRSASLDGPGGGVPAARRGSNRAVIRGSSTAPPAARSSTARTSASGSASLSRNPCTPTRSAS